MHRLLLLFALLVLPFSTADAQLVNGDFENGSTAWSTSGYPVTFPTTGGNPDGYARILQVPGNSGLGTVSQTFDCGPGPGDCQVTFDYRLTALSGPGVGDLLVSVDNEPNALFTVSAPTNGWQTATITYPCGVRTLNLQLRVLAEVFQQLEACFDNVTAVCVPATPVKPASWGRVKRLYE